MTGARMLTWMCLVAAAAKPVFGAALVAPPSAAAAGGTTDVSPLLAGIIARHDVPGMVAAVIEGDRVVAAGAAGVRKRGGTDKVTPADKFHIGSCTKAMTATLCAMLVEEGKLKWDTTVAAAFPDAKYLHADYRDVTLSQLLHHRGGVPGELDGALWNSLWKPKGVASRRMVLEKVFALPPQAQPGTKYVYSNFGYAVAGHMAETATRKPWEDLMRERLFKPLAMTGAGFGAPSDRGNVRQPRGHTNGGQPVEPALAGSDNPPAIGPGGTVHCSVGDWAKFVTLHLRGARGDATLLKAETFKKLHAAPEGNPYAMGWLAGKSPLGDGPALNHAGSNTLWYAVAGILPEQDVAVVVMCNRGGPGGAGAKACDEASGALLRRPASAK